jgi:transcriptional regulator with XRE-family HTH domain
MTYDTISKLKYHVREEIKELLDTKKESRNDWRGVASRMNVKPSTIEKIEKEFKENPTQKLLEEISDKKTREFLQVLCRMDRHDVLNIFYEEMCTKKAGSLPLCKNIQTLL